MLKQLEYSVTFPSTGRTLSEAVLFEGGFGAIVGPNESGKSMIIEMIRYCLFGAAALRGKAEDYKNLKASLTWAMKGSEYLVERTTSKAKLTRDGEVIAVGTTPVNVKVPAEIGFGLAVFDMACVANQNQLLKLGEMKPSERQRAVDSVIGAAVLDDLAELASREALALKRAAEDLRSNIQEPVRPTEPDNYQPSAKLEERKEVLDQLRSTADQLKGWLANTVDAAPRPVDRTGLGSAVIQDRLDQQNARKIQIQTLEAELSRIPAAANITLKELEADEEAERQQNRYLARKKFLTYNRKVEWDQAHLDQKAQDLADHRTYMALEHLKTELADLEARGHHECPSCTHQWPVVGDVLSEVKAKIEAIEARGVRKVDLNGLTQDKLEGYQRQLNAWLAVEAEWETVHKDAPSEPVAVQWTVQDRQRHRFAIEGRARRAELEDQIRQLQPNEAEPDYAAMLRQRLHYEAQLSVWADKVAAYERWVAERDEKQHQLAELEGQLEGYDQLVKDLDQARWYEHQMLAYSSAFQHWDIAQQKLAGYLVEADDWSRVKDALKLLRLKIKQHLVPSLNRVASGLITHMTGGERQTIRVDDEFNITVDGQTLDTLSGSGAAVANLALRLGLGQVLTNNVFSLFAGDEIDASMDKNRSEKTSQVLGSLRGHISQLLLVSHKFPAADYYIAVGENIDHELCPN